ncbi:MAG: hypothetical protein KAW88_02435 [Candidatus Cloacimonetes bacterium]|nr:hypothetical protein [Candidatus Cloacimonadota bacterium]
MIKYVLLIAISLVVFSCTGEESLGVDTTAPEQPELVPHLGDTGDITLGDTLNYYNTNDIELENNGIDAVSEGNWMQIQWYHLVDSDIDYLEIFRFSVQDYYNDTLDFVSQIDVLDYNDQSKYVDKSAPVEKYLFYFINAIDEAGNSTLSDTVAYKLINKPALLQPANLAQLDENEITFEWAAETSAIQYRLLVFDLDRNLIWQYTPLDLEDLSVEYFGPDIEPGTTLIWRVDAFGQTGATFTIEGNNYNVDSGSESEERYIFIQ